MAIRREHVEHFIATLDDRDPAKQLTILRVTDAGDMEETLRAYQQMEASQMKASMGSNKYTHESTVSPNLVPSKATREVRAIRVVSKNGSSESESSGSEGGG